MFILVNYRAKSSFQLRHILKFKVIAAVVQDNSKEHQSGLKERVFQHLLSVFGTRIQPPIR